MKKLSQTKGRFRRGTVALPLVVHGGYDEVRSRYASNNTDEIVGALRPQYRLKRHYFQGVSQAQRGLGTTFLQQERGPSEEPIKQRRKGINTLQLPDLNQLPPITTATKKLFCAPLP